MASREAVVVVDDDDAVRESLQSLLETAGFSVQVYQSAGEFIAHCPGTERGCVLLDIQMPGINGLALQKRLAADWPGLSVVIITGHGDVAMAIQAMKAGAVDFVEKPFNHEILVDVIRSATEQSRRKAKKADETTELAERLRRLSKRESQVLEGLVAGLPNKTIAADLRLSPRTVEIYRARLRDKMQVRSLSELIRMATMAGIRPK